jgi:hypothetical protein
VPWTNLDAKAIRDRPESAEKILDLALASPKVMSCSEATAECAKKIIDSFATRAFPMKRFMFSRTVFSPNLCDKFAMEIMLLLVCCCMFNKDAIKCK